MSKLNDSESEAAETQSWIEYAVKCGYLERGLGAQAYRDYDGILSTLVGMVRHLDTWIISDRSPAK